MRDITIHWMQDLLSPLPSEGWSNATLNLRAGKCTHCMSQTANASYKHDKEKEQFHMLCGIQQLINPETGATTQRVMDNLVD